MNPSLAMKIELAITFAGVVACGVLVTLGYLNDTYAGLAIGALGGSGVRAAVSSKSA